MRNSIAESSCESEGDDRSVCVIDRRADGVDIDDPTDRRPSEERNRQRQEHDEQDCILRRLEFVQLAEPIGEQLVSRQGVDQAACGDVIADETGDDSAHDRDGENDQAGAAHARIDGVKRRQFRDAVEIVEIVDVLEPTRIFRREHRGGEQSQECVRQSRRDDCAHYDQKGFSR